MNTKSHSAAPGPDDAAEPLIAGRYVVVRPLGQGGAGAVWLVRDRETGEQLALKRLLRVDAEGAARLKREFRVLAGIHHPNLIRLYDFGYDRGSAFYTMEYLQGADLLHHLGAPTETSATGASSSRSPEWDQSASISRVLGVFRQLATGVHALHAAGVLHRDLKPSNVLVVGDRVVVLDFGLAHEFGEGATTMTHANSVAGTPAYMAPEQLRGDHLGKANDWYSFGVMLYEALSGGLPIEGRVYELLQRKLTQDPMPIERLLPDLTPEVAELCMGLLRREPRERPPGERVLAVLKQDETSVMLSHSMPIPANDVLPSLFGRDAELAILQQAFGTACDGSFAVVHVFGESGSGKSTLVQHFLERLERPALALEPQALILRSRCYERETMPFKALDGALDAIVEHLSREGEAEVGYALPQLLHALVQRFPVLGRLPAVPKLLGQPRPPKNVIQARDEADAALREMLTRLAQRRPVVLSIDDLQWGDLDSASLLEQWLRAPLLRSVMLLLSYRSEEIETSACVATLRKEHAAPPAFEALIAVEPLADADIRALCEQRIEGADRPSLVPPVVLDRIVREASGSPFLALQLTELALSKTQWRDSELGGVSLQELIEQRSAALTADARRMLSVIAVAGRPIILLLALRVAELDRDIRAVLHELHSAGLLRTRDVNGQRSLEIYHDRLREALLTVLSPAERIEIDRKLLRELEALGGADVDWLHALALAAGERDAALRYGMVAAERASATLAFEHAAQLYQRCLELDDGGASTAELWHKLALAFAHGGHGVRAASAYLEAAKRADPRESVSLERLAASHLLRSGRFEDGLQLIGKVLRALELDAPASQAGLLAAIGWERARLALRGMRFTARPREAIPPEQWHRSELCGTLAIELATHDPLRAALYQARALRMALDAGDATTVARALTLTAVFTSADGTQRAARKAKAQLDRAEAIASGLDNPLVHANIRSARAMSAFLTSQFKEAIDYSIQAEKLDRHVVDEGEYHHRFTVLAARISALLQLGDVRGAELILGPVLKEARATDNVSAILHLSLSQTRVDVAAGREELALERLAKQRRLLPQQGFGLLHLFHLMAVLRAGTASGAHAEALRDSAEAWAAFERSIARRSPTYSLVAYATHARVVLNRRVAERQTGSAAALVAHDLKRMAGFDVGSPHLARTRARLAVLQDRPKLALARLRESAAGYERVGSRDELARDRHALGLLVGGDEGRALREAALTTLLECGTLDPIRELHSYYPELLSE